MQDEVCEGPCEKVVKDSIPPCPLQCGYKGCKSYSMPPDPDLRALFIIWMFGGPSSGKTTQTNMLCSKYGLNRIHVGEMLKAEIVKRTDRAPCLRNCIERGELAPNDVAIELIRNEIVTVTKRAPATTKGFVIDGFPRDPRQGQLFEKNITPTTLFIYLEADVNTLRSRHLPRARVTQQRWPMDKRNDSCPHGLWQIHLFLENVKNIVSQYPHKLVRVNTENKSTEQISAEIVKATDKAFAVLKAQTQARAARELYYQTLGIEEKDRKRA